MAKSGELRFKLRSDRSSLLLVEGTHDEMVIEALLKVREIPADTLQIAPVGGKSLLATNLRLIVNDANFRTFRAVAVVRDADTILEPSSASADSPTASERARLSVTDAFKAAGLAEPEKHAAFTAGEPRTGLFILPDGAADGMLEDMLRDSVRDSPESACVEAFFRCLRPADGPDRSVPAKAWSQAFVAAQPQPDLHVGLAAREGYWDLNSTVFDRLADFLRELVRVASGGESAAVAG